MTKIKKELTKSMKINTTTVFNQWLIFSKDDYELVNTIDFEINKPILTTDKTKFQETINFIRNSVIGEQVLEYIKTQNLNKQYDAFVINHVMDYDEKNNKLNIGVDCFKRIK